MVDISVATTLADFHAFHSLLDEMAVWDDAETRAQGHDTTALLLEAYSDSAEDLLAHFTGPGATLFLAYHGGKLAGCGGFSGAGDGVAEVEKIYVRPEFRGLGMGAALLRAVMTGMSSGGYQRARLETTTFMTSAIALYGHFGFTIVAPFRPSLGNLGSMSVFMDCELGAQDT